MLVKESVKISTAEVVLEGDLTIPESPEAIILFAHGSGSSRFSPRNRYVAEILQKRGLATLLLDLLTEEEESLDEVTAQFRFNIQLLAERLVEATDWISDSPQTGYLKVGYFGASTGAAAALIAAAQRPGKVYAVVSRGGRPDMAEQILPEVQAPSLLIIGGNDDMVIDMNRTAFDLLICEKKMEIVPGATHLFEEPGTLEQVAALAGAWFKNH